MKKLLNKLFCTVLKVNNGNFNQINFEEGDLKSNKYEENVRTINFKVFYNF